VNKPAPEQTRPFLIPLLSLPIVICFFPRAAVPDLQIRFASNLAIEIGFLLATPTFFKFFQTYLNLEN
jgi:hypothetical protein